MFARTAEVVETHSAAHAARRRPFAGGVCNLFLPVLGVAAVAMARLGCAVAPKVCATLRKEFSASADSVQVVFLGVGGLLIRWQGVAVLTAPLYSNPTAGELALSTIHTDRQRVDELLRDDIHDLSTVRAILVGHSHYDHLMDVPYVALKRAVSAEVIGNDAMVKLLAPIADRLGPRRLVSLEGQGPSSYHLVPGTRIRVRAVRSIHSPQITKALLADIVSFPDVTLWRGEDELPRQSLPSRAGDWTCGTPQAFVIELLEADSDTVAFRIYYQDSPSFPPYGYPDWPKNTAAYDLVLLCTGGATGVSYRGFPADIVSYLHPRFVMGIHWEDFLNPRALPVPGATAVREEIPFAPGVSEEHFLNAVEPVLPDRGAATVPCPDATTVFRRDAPGSWTIAASTANWTAPRSSRK